MKIIREWTELTQEEFGKSIGKKRKTIQHYELGERNYNIVTLLEIAKKHNLLITIEKKIIYDFLRLDILSLFLNREIASKCATRTASAQ